MPATLAVIPARHASSRLPAKPLALIAGRPMVEWVLRRTEASGVFDRVVVATDHQEIADLVNQLGGQAVMTSADCQTGTDRVADAARQFPEAEIVANVQGDQPFVETEMLRALVAPYLAGETPDMTTVATRFGTQDQFEGPSAVKVIRDARRRALYFSRSVIPHGSKYDSGHSLHHLGLYAFRAEFLQSFCKMPQTPLELCESLEQLRCLENGNSIYVSEVARPVIEVNTAAELEQANQIAEQERLTPNG
ncbi:3-deoxy-manno-octulosonate cytidylyltransferase [Posidoniimonas polymericola]|uniref:3-deoxy-manno-octulosonate cytidylyltransferase n=1 Tax=Posidoniimonas polymericola TaxID=2528002 RepID=A0A5C5YAS1_9BACT|nr:3-deoxy-manno-octulosonate cytidylyltransferase [Posidoniimonas polymericola]TWT72806.1 3-deoxy-manno-octulosonate cytidylyltransferase [Posidoniimonas polymericola]